MTLLQAVDDSPSFVVLCPTAQGGHLEHAINLGHALAATSPNSSVEVWSRAGAKEYAGRAGSCVREVFPSIAGEASGFRARIRAALRAVREYWIVVRRMQKLRPGTIMIIEEPRFVVPDWLSSGIGRVLILHNVVEHSFSAEAGPIRRLRFQLIAKGIEFSNKVVVHGAAQQESAVEVFGVNAFPIELPGSGFFENTEVANSDSSVPEWMSRLGGDWLCIGEVRKNKGFEVAAEAAHIAKQSISIFGKCIDESVGRSIRQAALDDAYVTYRDGFLTAIEFEIAMRSCRGVVLPYTEFAAQSGVLARAMQMGKTVLVSDLPSLVEQLGDYKLAEVFPAGDALKLAELLFSSGYDPSGNSVQTESLTSDSWDEYACALLAIVEEV